MCVSGDTMAKWLEQRIYGLRIMVSIQDRTLRVFIEANHLKLHEAPINSKVNLAVVFRHYTVSVILPDSLPSTTSKANTSHV